MTFTLAIKKWNDFKYKGEKNMFSLFKKKCAVCKQKAAEPRKYYDDQQKAVFVCMKCVIYAERRAFRKRSA